MISIFLTILFTSSFFSTLIILAACIASSRSTSPVTATPIQAAQTHYAPSAPGIATQPTAA